MGDGCLGGSAVPKDDGKYCKNKHGSYLKRENEWPQKYEWLNNIQPIR